MEAFADLESFLVSELSREGYDLDKSPKAIQEAVLRLSDFYIEHPDWATPWDQKWALAAYLAYNHVLGHLRLTKLFGEIERQDFLKGITTAVDFGSGSGVAIPFLSKHVERILSVELSEKLLNVQQRLAQHIGMKSFLRFTPNEFLKQQSKALDPSKTVLLLSFVLTEIKDIPSFAKDFEALILVEPGLKSDTRRLMETRTTLMERGYSIWAPCTHAGSCPLLTESKRDWCHDKTATPTSVLEGPFKKVFDGLPFDHRSPSFSYLIARRSVSPTSIASAQKLGRVIGDHQVEKGKTRQLICRGPHREFLSFLAKTDPNPPRFERGDIVEWSDFPEVKGGELRGGNPQKKF